MQGQTINGYTLKHRLGEGGMAEVWYAENEIGKPAAVKILNENLSRKAQIVERFHNEALVMVKLDHPNIRQVYGYGYLGDRHCIIMEYLDGDDLEAMLKSGRRFTDEELRRWWNQTVDALNYTHSMGIVHRDIKPSNLFLDKKGNIKLLDFGIAKVKESMSMTRTGMAMGTLMYMSPEQVKDPKRVDAKSDVYSLAVTFVHLLTGKPIYDSDTSSEYDIQVSIVTEPVDLSLVPEGWRDFLAPYLEKDPKKRPALRAFESVQSATKVAEGPAKKAEQRGHPAATVVSPQPKEPSNASKQDEPVNQPQHQESAAKVQSKQPVAENQPSEPNDKPKSKSGLWIGLGVGGAAIVALLVLFFVSGNGVEKTFAEGKAFYDAENYTEALPFLTEAAEKGHSNAQYCLGRMYYEGLGVDRDLEKAFSLAYKSAMQDDDMGQNLLGVLYVNGAGVALDYYEAVSWYRKAAAQGNIKAFCNLGFMYLNGNGVEENHEEAAKWFRKAAEQGDDRGQYWLGELYLAGDGVENNFDEAVKWFRKAAEQGNSYGQASLGVMYLMGWGVVMEDYEEAVYWLQKSVAQDNDLGQYFMGNVYENGLGVDVDVEEAKKWYQKAAEQGNTAAIEALERLEKESAVKGGVFSVSALTKVHFSKGNLQYQPSTGEWRIAPNPWDMIGKANENISPTYSGWIDLFGWGTGDDPTKTTKEDSDYSYFTDWGEKYGGDWRTLTIDEWQYVLHERSTASGLLWAGVKLNGVDGFVLLPDDWNSSNFNLTYTNKTLYDIVVPDGNKISISTWNDTFDPAGAIFMPAAGRRESYSSRIEFYGDNGGYWSSTRDQYSDYRARFLYFYDPLSYELYTDQSRERSSGYSVRLVCPVP